MNRFEEGDDWHPRCRGRSIQTNLIEQPVETCVTVTWIKLCYKLLCLTKDPKWADQMEIALYRKPSVIALPLMIRMVIDFAVVAKATNN